MPPRDTTAIAVDRAHAVAAELAARAAAANADAARAAELEPDEEARRHELNRWADLDVDGNRADDDGEALDRNA